MTGQRFLMSRGIEDATRPRREDSFASRLRAPAANSGNVWFYKCGRKLSPVSRALKLNALLAQATLVECSRLRKTVASSARKLKEEITRVKTGEAHRAVAKKSDQLKESKAALRI